MKNKSYFQKKLQFFEKESYSEKGENVVVDPKDFSDVRRYEFNQVYSLLNVPTGKKIIELGAGYGRFVLPLLSMGYHVTAVDISKKLLRGIQKVAKRNHLEKKLHIKQADFSKAIYKNTFDAAFCVSTYHLSAETQKKRKIIFSNLVKSVKPGGVVMVVEPNPLNPLLYLLYVITSQASWEVEKHFRESHEWHLKKIFQEEHLREIRIKYVGFLPLRYKTYPFVTTINRLVNEIPFVNKFSTFIYIKGKKSK